MEFLRLVLSPAEVAWLTSWVTWAWSWRWWGMALVALGIVMRAILVRPPVTASQDSHGTARFATPQEIRRSKKFHGTGLLVGRVGRQIVQLDYEEDVLIVGPKGTGKSTGLIIPNLLRCPTSVICVDLSGELVQHTAAVRQQMGPVYVFDPLNPRGAHYNFFDGIRWDVHAVMDVQRVVEHLTYMDEKTVHTDAGTFYRPWAKVLLTALIVYIHESQTYPANPAGLLRYFSDGANSIFAALKHLASYPDETVASSATMLLKNKPEILMNIWSSALMWLLIWQDPLLASVTSDTTIPIEAFQHGDAPVTLYLRFSVEDMTGRLNRQFRIMAEQIGNLLCDRDDPTAYVHEVTWAFDDMAQLGYFPLITIVPAHRRKYGHRFWGACQSFGQIFDTYGPNAAGLLDNCTSWVLLRPMNHRSAQFITEQLDAKTVVEPTEQVTRRGWSESSRSTGERAHRRWLITPDELMRLGDRQGLLCVSGERPVVFTQQRWYEEDR